MAKRLVVLKSRRWANKPKQQYVEVLTRRSNWTMFCSGVFLFALFVTFLVEASGKPQGFFAFILTWIGGTTMGVVATTLMVVGLKGKDVAVRHYIKTEGAGE